jgi:hypothetical protein
LHFVPSTAAFADFNSSSFSQAFVAAFTVAEATAMD